MCLRSGVVAMRCCGLRGESLLIVGPQGVGKTTIAQQVVLARLGLRKDVLSMPITVDDRPVLYIAADRPSQVQRSFARMVTEDDREILSEGLLIWRGPLPFNVSTEPERFAALVADLDVGTVVIDSLKDVAVDLSKDESGSRVNAALQQTLALGIEVLGLHHQRKAQASNKKPTTLSDVYGSVWITSGRGIGAARMGRRWRCGRRGIEPQATGRRSSGL